jgi:hypothetical protein
VAITATPEGTWATVFTPGTARARSASTCLTVAPKTGGRATRAVSMPGSVASIPKVASPVTFAWLSRRRVALPMSFHSDGGLRGGSAGTGMVAARSTSCP